MLKAGYVAVAGNFSTFNCVIRDLSETGAKIELESFTVLPQHFTLHIHVDGSKIECERVWQKNLFFGVRFIGEWDTSAKLRDQKISTSEGALSQRVLSEMEARQRALGNDQQNQAPDPVFRRHQQAPAGRTFGKRVGPEI